MNFLAHQMRIKIGVGHGIRKEETYNRRLFDENVETNENVIDHECVHVNQ